MLLHKMFARTIHTSRHLFATGAGLEKSALAALRKKTGYTFANCKKALELHNNDVNEVRERERERDNKHPFMFPIRFGRQKNGCINRRKLWAGQRPPNWPIV